MATALSEWEKKVMPDLPNVPYPAMIDAVRDACIKFCKETWLWTYTLDRINIVANTRTYALTPPAGGAIIGTDDVKYKQDGLDDDQFVTLDPISEVQMDLHYGSAWSFQESTSPSKHWLDNDKNIKLYKIPTVASAEGLLVRVVLKPTTDCTTVEDFIWDDHQDTIADGAKSDLMSKKGQPWYDPKLSDSFDNRFRNGYNNAKAAKISSYTKRPSRVRMREWL